MKTPGGGGFGVANKDRASTKHDVLGDGQQYVERGSVFEYRQAQESV